MADMFALSPAFRVRNTIISRLKNNYRKQTATTVPREPSSTRGMRILNESNGGKADLKSAIRFLSYLEDNMRLFDVNNAVL